MSWPGIAQIVVSPARQLLEEFTRAGVSTPVDVVERTSIFATLRLVQSSDAITVLSESVVRDHMRAKLLLELPISAGRDLGHFGLLRSVGSDSTLR